MVRLLLVRHAETVWNTQQRYQGHSDAPLSRQGQQQTEALARLLLPEPVTALYTSDLRRAWDTAQAIAQARGLGVQVDPRLREMAFGVWDGLTFAEIQQRYATELISWQADPLKVSPPGGETLLQVAERVQAVLADLAARCQEQTVVLVSHGGPLRVLLCQALGVSLRAYWQFALAPGSVSELCLYAEGAILTRLNVMHHLEQRSHGC